MTPVAAGNRWILVENRPLRLFTLFILYVAQGVPIGLFWFAIPAWMAANGASAASVGYVLGLTALPWTLKLVNGFIMDRYTFLAMGRRRIWIIGAQLVMIALLVGCALIGPGVTDLLLLGIAGFVVNMATTFQDVGVDGMAARPRGGLPPVCRLHRCHHPLSAAAQGACRRAAGAVERG